MISSTENSFSRRPSTTGAVFVLHSAANLGQLVAEAARREGASYAACCDVTSCLSQLEAEGPRCVVAEVAAMQNDAGPDLIGAIESRQLDAPVIVVTPECLPEAHAQRLGAWAVLPQPPMVDSLAIALRDALQQSTLWQEDRELVTQFRRCVNQLSSEELRVMRAVCDGKLNKQIARDFGVSIRTVEQRRRRVFAKMNVASAIPLASRMATVETIERLRPALARGN